MGIDEATAWARCNELMRGPRKVALTSGIIAIAVAGVAIVQVTATGNVSLPMVVFAVVAVVLALVTLRNAIMFSPAAINRLKEWAERKSARFTWLKPGASGYGGVVFDYTVEHERFGVVDYVDDDIVVEIGHVASQLSAQYRAKSGRRQAYVALRLPRRLPHMIVDFGMLGTFFGVRLVPFQWHRSQRVDVGGGRRFRLFVADGGEQFARTFFSPEMVSTLASIGRYFDVEVKGEYMYLFSQRSIASGGDARFERQLDLLDQLVALLNTPRTQNLLRATGLKVPTVDLRADVKRATIIFFSVVGVVIAVLSIIAIMATGILD